MIQLEGNIEIGGTDYSDEITSLVINMRRNTTTRPATFGNANRSQKAGDAENSVTINFINDTVSTALQAELLAAIQTDSAELTFAATLLDEAVGADNPTYSGTMIVTDLDIGGDVGVENQQRKTYPLTEAGVAIAVA